MSEPVTRPVTEATAARAVSTSRSAWRRPEERLTGRGEPHAAACPVEQLGTEFFLQLPDGQRQRWLGDEHGLRRAGGSAVIGHREEVSQAPQIHLKIV